MIYFPLLNPIIFQPLLEKVPATAELFRGRAQVFPSGASVQIQLYSDDAAPETPIPFLDYDDGTVGKAPVTANNYATATNSRGTVCRYVTLTVTLPVERVFRVRLSTGDSEAVSGCVTTRNDMAGYCRLAFGGSGLLYDAYMGDRGFTFSPTVYVKGGFFTGGFSPVIEGEEFIDGNRVSRYLSAWPAVTREFVIGGAQGIDNRLAAMLNMAFCLPSVEIDGRAYVRYSGAELKALGDKSLPCRAWSVTLQNAEGDWSTAADLGVSGALVDAAGRYLVDAAGVWIKTN